IGRKAMNIDGLGEETIETYYNRGLVRHISDGNTLYKHADQLKTLERCREGTIENMLKGIEDSKAMPFEKVLFGLGIRYVGETVAKKLAYVTKDIYTLVNASMEDLTGINEIGQRIAESVIEYFKNPEHLEQVRLLK